MALIIILWNMMYQTIFCWFKLSTVLFCNLLLNRLNRFVCEQEALTSSEVLSMLPSFVLVTWLNVYTQTHVTFVLIWHNFFSRESPFQIDNLFMCIEMLTQGFVSISQILQCLILYISNCCEFKLLSFYFLFVHYCTLTCAIMIMNDVKKKKNPKWNFRMQNV